MCAHEPVLTPILSPTQYRLRTIMTTRVWFGRTLWPRTCFLSSRLARPRYAIVCACLRIRALAACAAFLGLLPRRVAAHAYVRLDARA